MSLQRTVLLAVFIFCIFSLYMILQHEKRVISSPDVTQLFDKSKIALHRKRDFGISGNKDDVKSSLFRQRTSPDTSQSAQSFDSNVLYEERSEEGVERKGLLKCDGNYIDSEIIYWKIVPGDNEYESPITPHHNEHDDRYLTYEYDEGGWNNIRMSLECVLVFTHAMGRTLVSPPRQNLYLVDKKYKARDGTMRRGMGFEDFFDMELLKSHKGYHVMTSEEFLAKEGVTGRLHGILPPKNSTKIGGRELNQYYRKVADKIPEWRGKFLVMPDSSMNISEFDISKLDQLPDEVKNRMKQFGGERSPVFYGKDLQNARHIHFQNGKQTRLLQHHYAFNFFADKDMQSFYKRFVRDYLRYQDDIQCHGHELVKMIREDARVHNKNSRKSANKSTEPDDAYYALHVRRGDFQYKDVKISALEIVKNLIVDGLSVIPRGALVYLSTDDPKGICDGCRVQGIPCTKYKADGKYPQGCPEDASWDAFRKAGWTLRFFADYSNSGSLSGVNPNTVGMLEVIACSRAEVFAGTFYSSFTGYIHRLRGYHGIGEQSYYHSTNRVTKLRMKKSVGHGFTREWRAGWTDDEGGLI